MIFKNTMLMLNETAQKSGSPKGANALLISAIVVFVLGMLAYAGILFWTKRIRKKYDQKAHQEAIIKIESLRNDVGILPQELKKIFNSKENDYDIEGTINTIYQNSFTNALVVSNDLYPFACISQKTKNPIFYELESFKFDEYNKARMNPENNLANEIKPYENQELDFVAIFSSNQNINDLYDKYFSKLKDNGMLLVKISNFPKREINLLLNHLALEKKKHEVSYFGTKILFVVK